MMDELSALIKAIRDEKNDGRHDGLGNPVIGVDLYQTAALKACDEIERLQRIVAEFWDTFYGQGFQLVNWHLNGDVEPIDTFFEHNDWAADVDGIDVTTRICVKCGFRWHDGPEECPLCQSRELNALFDLQWTRTVEADAAYVAAHPKPGWPHGYKPDLGRLVGWLMEEAGLKERSE